MDQDSFVRVRKPRWDSLDGLVAKIRQGGFKSLDEGELKALGALYREASSDLAFATSCRYDPALVSYLNGCVTRAYGEIYREEPFSLHSVRDFYLSGFPRAIRENGGAILASALLFLLGMLVAFLVVYSRPDRASLFLDQRMVSSMERQGEKPACESLSLEEKSMISHQIMTNNIGVGIKAFASGIFLGAGTIWLLVTNGALLGALAALALHYHRSLMFWSLILPHGVIEFLAIFIAGGAGFLLALALVSPGMRSRADALKLRGREAARLMVGVLMLFAVAAVVEGFVTPMAITPSAKLVFSLLVALLLFRYVGGKAGLPEGERGKAMSFSKSSGKHPSGVTSQ
ncbi:MAG: stage II sporulation protein M [Candidatus Eremiobacteraeota bacterium]|nr:stage II sporulation protein M [Candidatus Eremiobacteraeota bacterium]